ncbi:MAG: 16S rRNA (uracil(1498)-N(3))-methyltransferase, partial [Proteobacteria bacterium]|nr:16S rRNA (uracil(1498)-N(3))-methyltransferase [Pseudomonadota bacterium]MBU1708986.1 16S rRNA (uracil(1498)-N(3))-methyltransferase [Pseudomonadota bacterium]
MRRFFVDPDKITGDRAILTDTEAHHIKNVLRLAPGKSIRLFDGSGNIYTADIEKLAKTQVEVRITASEPAKPTGPEVCLGQALLTGKKFDLIIQKATELGIHSLFPFVSAHSTAKQTRDNKLSRWERISFEACKQSNRPVPMKIQPISDYQSLLTSANEFDRKIIFWEDENSRSLDQLHPLESMNPQNSLLFLIGPEGGFRKDEVALATQNGFSSVTLGPRILRAET